MWSRKPMPVAISDAPVPSSATRPLILVSLVLRSTVATRTAVLPTGFVTRTFPARWRLLTRTGQPRHSTGIIAENDERPVSVCRVIQTAAQPLLVCDLKDQAGFRSFPLW